MERDRRKIVQKRKTGQNQNKKKERKKWGERTKTKNKEKQIGKRAEEITGDGVKRQERIQVKEKRKQENKG